jgi:hypothetical protein
MTQERLNQCNVRLLRDEIDILAMWHRDRETECARSSDYRNAEVHKNRADELFRISDWLIRRSEAAA